jgi:hypothetical protein
MQTLIRRTIFFLFLSCFLMLSFATAQPERARERIQQMKKMKLLDVLKLNEQEADKFIVKYSAWENKIEDQKGIVDKVSDDLFELLRNDGKGEEVSRLSNSLLAERKKFMNMELDKLKAMKEVLNDVQYAKFLVFEDRFLKELGRMMMQRGGSRGGPPPEGIRGKRFE